MSELKFTGFNTKLCGNAKNLRNSMTVEERRLWYDFLRHYPVKFYRQHIIDNYIADFFCHQAKLVIEVDGSQHYTAAGQIYDQHRTAELRKHNLLVIRFTNLDIKDRFREVCDMIDSVVSERIGFNPWGAEPPLQQS